MPVRCLRYSASNSASFAVLCSGPYHQHQSLPSAARRDSNAVSKCGFGWRIAAALFPRFGSPAIRLPRIPEELPRGDVFGVSDPHVEIRVDPGSGENAAVRGHVLRRSDGFGCGERAEVLIARDAPVKFTQEFATVARVIFPGVLAIQKKTDREGIRALRAFTEIAQLFVQILRGGFRVHPAVDEADQIGELMIAKESGDRIARDLHAPRFVQTLGICRDARGIAEETNVERSSENPFVGTEPLEAFLDRNR